MHIHKYKTLSAVNAKRVGPVTLLLMRCLCGKFKTEEIDGNWAEEIKHNINQEDRTK